jgi:hypothetical protein
MRATCAVVSGRTTTIGIWRYAVSPSLSKTRMPVWVSTTPSPGTMSRSCAMISARLASVAGSAAGITSEVIKTYLKRPT